MENNNEARARFEKILRDTGRENIDYVIEDLDAWGFFTAPASAKGHGAYPGGLLDLTLMLISPKQDPQLSLVIS